MNTSTFSVFRMNLKRKTLVFGFALLLVGGLAFPARSAAFVFASLSAQQAGVPGAGSEPVTGSEPVFAVLQGELAFDRNTASASGQIFVNQALCVRLTDFDVYQGWQLELEPGQAEISAQNRAKQQNANRAAISLLLYTQLRRSEEPDGAPYRGVRLLTRAIAGKAVLRFALATLAKSGSGGARSNARNAASTAIDVAAFPVCMVLYSFGTAQKNGEAQAAAYRYILRFVPKNFGFVQFRLFLPKNSGRAVNLPGANLPNDWEPANFRFQIDQRPYELEAEPKENHQNRMGETSGVFTSRLYELALGEHNARVESRNSSASAQFSIEPGQTKVVDLLLQERLARLRIVLPQGASLLVDGIPLRRSRRSGAAPVWQNVEIRRLEGYQYALPRLEYRLNLPAGNHHLLLQYEGKTWERKLYFAEGEEQYFELNWQLGGANAAQ